MGKAVEENKYKVKIKRLVWEFNLYWKFMCTDKNNDKNKNSPSTAVYGFSGFQFIFINVYWKIKDYFVLQICSGWVEKKHSF